MKHIRRIVIVLIWLLIWQFASMMTGLELLLASPVPHFLPDNHRVP